MSDDIETVIPEDTAVPFLELTLKTGGAIPHAFIRDETLISSKWQFRCQTNPHLFNGSVFLQAGLGMEQSRLSGAAVKLDYASFMHWRGNPQFQSETNLHNVFPLAEIKSSDGHLIAVRSASTTVNSGLIYFAAGMFDEHDVVDDQLNHFGNMKREVAEETGLDSTVMHTDNALTVFRTGRFVAIFQRFRSDLSSNMLAEKVRRFISLQPTPEIDDVIVIANASDITEQMPGYMQAYRRWRFTEL